jgi:DNA-binding beta-propeller fold protein YncE
MRKFLLGVTVLAVMSLSARTGWSQDLGPVGPSPYEAVDGWLKPFDEGFTFGGNVGVQPDTPNRIFILQRGSTRLPNPVPSGYLGYAGSIGMSPQKGEARVYRNIVFVVDGNGKMIEAWNQWDHLFARTDQEVGVHRVRISPYDRERRVWVIDESAHQIHVFSNDGKTLVMSLGEKNVSGSDTRHFGRPQDVAFLPDGRILVADGLDNHRVVILDKDMNYLGEFGGMGRGPGQFNGIHAIGIGANGRIYALDRSGGRVNVFKTTADPAKMEFVEAWPNLRLPRSRRQHPRRSSPEKARRCRSPSGAPGRRRRRCCRSWLGRAAHGAWARRRSSWSDGACARAF